jgi:DNA-binding transcriptional regulator YiaG
MTKEKPDSTVSQLRRRLNLTQEEFAHAIGVTVSTVNRWENGHIEPSRLARKAIAELETHPPARVAARPDMGEPMMAEMD